MASVERAMAKAAAALLPGLLSTPPSMITPSPCIIILPVASNPNFPKPGRADSAGRWDAHKKDDKTTKPRSTASSASSFGSSSPGRADSVEHWDINKKRQSPGSSSSISSTSSSSQGSSTSKNPGRVPSCERCDSSKRPPSRADSADRWDAHKKTRAAAASQTDQEEIVDKEDVTTSKKMTEPVFSGPSFVASPEPTMLPMPAFFPRRAGMIPRPAFVRAH